jgi:glycerol kinase
LVKYVLALDQGTTSSRAIVFDQEGASVAVSQRELTQIFPQPGWVEHDPKEIFASQRDVAREALRRSGIQPRELLSIGITNQRETTVVWDRQTGEPIHHAIVWQDRRTTELCARLRAEDAEREIRERTGLVVRAPAPSAASWPSAP